MTRRYGMGPQEARQAARELEPSRIIEPPRLRQRRDQQGARRRTAGRILAPDEMMELNLLEKFISMGAASGPLTGEGIWQGLDGADWEWRVGDPTGNYIHWDGSDFTIKAENFIGSSPVFTGTLQVYGGGPSGTAFLFTALSDGAFMSLHENGGLAVGDIHVTDASGADDISIRADNGLILESDGGDITLDVDSSGFLVILNLPTSDPGGSNRVWSNAGSLEIT